jgi:hypothetical protein
MIKKHNLSMDMLKQFLTCSLLLLSMQTMADQTISQIYENQTLRTTPDMATRIDVISAQFLEKPYMRTALGEGEHGYYDTAPLYRTDAFDCETFVDTVLALAIANDPATFEQCLRKIRYKDGKVSFLYRNHFTCLDWNQNNRKQGFIKDITSTFHDQNGQSITQMAKALIDKPSWYQHFSTDIIRIHNASLAEQEKRLAQLKEKGSHLPRAISITPYIPLTVLFNKAGEANMDIFNQIPNGAILEIVRPDWDLEQQIGTRLNISHLGFVFRKNGQLIFRAATSSHHRIMDCPLVDYLRETRKSPTIKGINIQIVTAPTQFAESVCK